MASIKKVDAWRLIGSVWTAWWLFITIWVIIADYPRNAMIWQLPHSGNAWFLWELAMIFCAWSVGLFYVWLSRVIESVNGVFKGFEALPDGRVVLVRKKRF